MATRFGGVSPAKAYATKVKWLVAGMATIIGVLLFTVIMIVNSSEARKDDVPTAPVDAGQPSVQGPAQADILVANKRIEQGERLEEHMFTFVQMEENKVPIAALRRKDLPSVVGKFAAKLIDPNIPVLVDALSENKPINPLNIPAGYRAVTITVDARTGVEGFAKPNTRVDVLWTFTQDGRQKVASIVRFTKILSVGGVTGTEANKANIAGAHTTVTLLVSEKDAKKIELARTLGTLSLSLVGEQEQGAKDTDPDAISIQDLIGRPATDDSQPEEVASDGVMYTSDPRSGKQMRYILKNGRWQQDRNY